MQTIQEDLQRQLSPLRVKVSIEYSDNVYYIDIDGRETYPDLQGWENWPDGIAGFGKAFLDLEKIKVQNAINNDNGTARFVVGSLFDMLKHE